MTQNLIKIKSVKLKHKKLCILTLVLLFESVKLAKINEIGFKITFQEFIFFFFLLK